MIKNSYFLVLLTASLFCTQLKGQNNTPVPVKKGTMVVRNSEKINYEDIQIYSFTSRDLPDSLEICGGEWFVKGEASTLEELDEKELKRIKEKIASVGCKIVFVDVKKVYSETKGQLYILGAKTKLPDKLKKEAEVKKKAETDRLRKEAERKAKNELKNKIKF
jgi:hypothetical protein